MEKNRLSSYLVFDVDQNRSSVVMAASTRDAVKKYMDEISDGYADGDRFYSLWLCNGDVFDENSPAEFYVRNRFEVLTRSEYDPEDDRE